MNEFYIHPDIEAYGTYARLSSLVDYFEVAALNNHNLSFSEMSELVKDSGWLESDINLIADKGIFISHESSLSSANDDEGDSEPGLSKTEEWKDAIQTTIYQRINELGASYPFEIRESRLIQKKFHRKHIIYLKFLAISFLHAFKIESDFTSHNLTTIFEESVTQCLKDKGLNGKTFGTAARSTGNFLDRVTEAFESYGFSQAQPIPHKKYAKDEKLDTIAGVSWGFGRNFNQHWMFLGQSTISISSEWESKMKELDSSYWANILRTNIEPQKFFSVPCHITDDYFTFLTSGNSGIILDRINLTKNLRRFTSEDIKLYKNLKSLH